MSMSFMLLCRKLSAQPRRARRMKSEIFTHNPTPATKITLHKFGGSSVGNSDAIKRVANVIRDRKKDKELPVAVTSALYGVTNLLQTTISAAEAGDGNKVNELTSTLKHWHAEQAAQLLDNNDADAYVDSLNQEFDLALDVCDVVAEQGRCDQDQRNWMLSLGERVSTPLVAAYLRSTGVSAVGLSAQELIVADEPTSEGWSAPIMAESIYRINSMVMPLLQADIVPVITGYLAGTTSGALTTLGRGGSDLSAAILAAALDSQSLHLWKVEAEKNELGLMTKWKDPSIQRLWTGVLSASPTVVGTTSRRLPYVSYTEAVEFCRFGKTLLHPETMTPVVDKGIPVFISNTAIPESDGTIIGAEHPDSSGGDSDHDAVAKGVVSVSLDRYEQISGGPTNLPLDKASRVVSIVGDDVDGDELQREVCSALDECGIPAVLPVRLAGSKNSVSVIVQQQHEEATMKVFHKRFIN